MIFSNGGFLDLSAETIESDEGDEGRPSRREFERLKKNYDRLVISNKELEESVELFQNEKDSLISENEEWRLKDMGNQQTLQEYNSLKSQYEIVSLDNEALLEKWETTKNHFSRKTDKTIAQYRDLEFPGNCLLYMLIVR